MAEMDDDLRMLLEQALAKDAFLDRIDHAVNPTPNAAARVPAASSPVSLMITNRQRAALRDLGLSDEAIRQMTPAAAHETLGLVEPSKAWPETVNPDDPSPDANGSVDA